MTDTAARFARTFADGCAFVQARPAFSAPTCSAPAAAGSFCAFSADTICAMVSVFGMLTAAAGILLLNVNGLIIISAVIVIAMLRPPIRSKRTSTAVPV